MSDGRPKKKGVTEGILTGLAMIAGGIALIWWTWTAPPPQSEPAPGEALVTVDVINLVDEVRSSSISGYKDHRVAFAYEVDGVTFCADGRTVNEGADATEACSQRWRDIGRDTYEGLHAQDHEARQVDVIYRREDPSTSFPVETRDGAFRPTVTGLGLALVGAVLLVFSVGRARSAR